MMHDHRIRRGGAALAVASGLWLGVATQAQAVEAGAPTFAGVTSAPSMIGSGVTPSAMGVSAAGGVAVGVSSLVVRAARRRLHTMRRPGVSG